MKVVAVDEHGRRVGESHPRAKLTDHEVELIRQLAEGELVRNAQGRFVKQGLTYAEIAAKFDISSETVKSIALYRKRATTVARFKRADTGGT
jgi:FixJ family two-component response regulator